MTEKKAKKEAKPGWYVKVVETEKKETASTFGPFHSERSADRVDRGVNINLNHERFHTETYEVKEKKARVKS